MDQDTALLIIAVIFTGSIILLGTSADRRRRIAICGSICMLCIVGLCGVIAANPPPPSLRSSAGDHELTKDDCMALAFAFGRPILGAVLCSAKR